MRAKALFALAISALLITWTHSSLEALNAYRSGISSDYFIDSYQASSNQLTLVMELDTNKYETGQQMNVSLRLTNGGDSEVVLDFPTPMFDFQVLDENEKEVYRWSSERAFLAVITTVTLKPGETIERSLTWAIDLEPGSYIVIGMTTRFMADGSLTILQTPRTTIQVTSSPGWVYWDASCTDVVSSIDWGLLEPGSMKNVPVYVRNEGDRIMTLSLNATDWNPSSAADYMTLSWDYAGQEVGPGEVIQVTLTLSISPSINGITDFSFEVVITGSG